MADRMRVTSFIKSHGYRRRGGAGAAARYFAAVPVYHGVAASALVVPLLRTVFEIRRPLPTREMPADGESPRLFRATLCHMSGQDFRSFVLARIRRSPGIRQPRISSDGSTRQ